MSDRVIVVVAYGHERLLADALGALDRDETVLVVDNSGRAETRAVVEEHGARYVDAGHNRGFAGGVNLALAELGSIGGDVVLLNPDARIGSGQLDVLQNVLYATGNEDVAAVAPQLQDPDGDGQRGFWPFPSPAGMWREAVGLARLARSPQSDGFVVGAVLLLRRAALDELGGFDEGYFLYAEEADWQRRARDRGWRAILVPHVRAQHIGAATSEDATARTARFHAAQETYIRRWFGPRGWQSYRAAAWLGASGRGLALPGAAGRAARERAGLYARGPRRSAPLPPTGRPLTITHVVVTAAFAGTERHVAALAAAQAAAGHDVLVIGGAPAAMPAAVAPARWQPGATERAAFAALRDGGPRAVVHTHLTAADLVGAAAGPWHGGRLVSSRHIAARRGSRPGAPLAARAAQRRIDAELAISAFVHGAIGRPATTVPNGVATSDEQPDGCSRQILVAQRLESEKATQLALDAFERSGLAQEGWTLVVAGDGAERGRLRLPAGARLAGWVADLRPTLLASAALLAPAPAEPCGLTVLEAMSVGLPVIAAAGGGHLETIGPVTGGLLFAPGDVAGAAAALRRLAALDPSERTQLGERGRARQRACFTLDGQVAATEQVYRLAPNV